MSRLGVCLLFPQKCFYCSVIVIVLFVFNICTCKTNCCSLYLFFLSPSFSHTLTFSFSLAVFFFLWLLRVSWRWIVCLSINDLKNGKVREGTYDSNVVIKQANVVFWTLCVAESLCGGLKINYSVFGKPFCFYLKYVNPFGKALSVCLNILSLPLFSCLFIYLFSGNPAVEATPGAVIITINF